MSTYRLINRSTYHEVTESCGIVTTSSPALDWSIGLSFATVRSYAERKGWKIIPVIDEELDSRVITFKGSEYVFFHDGINIRKITKAGREILWTDLPTVLKGLL